MICGMKLPVAVDEAAAAPKGHVYFSAAAGANIYTDLLTSCVAPSVAGAGSANATMTVQRELCAITSVPVRHDAGTIVHHEGKESHECFSLQCTSRSSGRDCCAPFGELATCVAGSVA